MSAELLLILKNLDTIKKVEESSMKKNQIKDWYRLLLLLLFYIV